MSMQSSDLIYPGTHHVRFTSSDFKIKRDLAHYASGSPSKFYLGSPVPRPRLKSLSVITYENGANTVKGSSFHRPSLSMVESGGGGQYKQACHICGEPLARQDAEVHHLAKHAVTEVLEGDSSRRVIEMIFKSGWTDFENRGRIGRILKVHNAQTKLAQFEEYRELVKIRANRLQHSKKRPCLLADGNELLRFYGTPIACSLGKKGSSSLCIMQRCNVCWILRHGFSIQEGKNHSILGIFTTSTSERAYRGIDIDVEEKENQKKALIVCRVIAGRVHRPVVESTNSQELSSGRRSGFDSLAGKLGSNSSQGVFFVEINSFAPLFCYHLQAINRVLVQGIHSS